MADVSHELGSLRLIVDAPLSSKVAMFNNHANQHQQAQLLNPFSGSDGRASPKPTFSKDQYGKPLAGSLTEMRGQKANMHVMREMLELCQIIDSEGYEVKDEPEMRVIPFGELFNIYNYISDKVVGILLRARKHKLVEFEGEILFQRRDDHVPVFLLKPIKEIRQELNEKIDDIKRASSPAPMATSLLLDKSAQALRLKVGGSKSNTPTPASSKAPSPARDVAAAKVTPPAVAVAAVAAAAAKAAAAEAAVAAPATTAAAAEPQSEAATAAAAAAAPVDSETKETEVKIEVTVPAEAPQQLENVASQPAAAVVAEVTEVVVTAAPLEAEPTTNTAVAEAPVEVTADNNNNDKEQAADKPTDINNNNDAVDVADATTSAAAAEVPTIVIEASAVYVRAAEGAVENEVAAVTQEESAPAPPSEGAAETAAV